MLILTKSTWDNMGHVGQAHKHWPKRVPPACPMFFEVGQTQVPVFASNRTQRGAGDLTLPRPVSNEWHVSGGQKN
jgi:hypothetical protein